MAGDRGAGTQENNSGKQEEAEQDAGVMQGWKAEEE